MRQAVVEPVFGSFKERRSFRRFKLRGLIRVRANGKSSAPRTICSNSSGITGSLQSYERKLFSSGDKLINCLRRCLIKPKGQCKPIAASTKPKTIGPNIASCGQKNNPLRTDSG
jgi:hypothetical protein